jgi:hypothetical protein
MRKAVVVGVKMLLALVALAIIAFILIYLILAAKGMIPEYLSFEYIKGWLPR